MSPGYPEARTSSLRATWGPSGVFLFWKHEDPALWACKNQKFDILVLVSFEKRGSESVLSFVNLDFVDFLARMEPLEAKKFVVTKWNYEVGFITW